MRDEAEDAAGRLPKHPPERRATVTDSKPLQRTQLAGRDEDLHAAIGMLVAATPMLWGTPAVQ